MRRGNVRHWEVSSGWMNRKQIITNCGCAIRISRGWGRWECKRYRAVWFAHLHDRSCSMICFDQSFSTPCRHFTTRKIIRRFVKVILFLSTCSQFLFDFMQSFRNHTKRIDQEKMQIGEFCSLAFSLFPCLFRRWILLKIIVSDVDRNYICLLSRIRLFFELRPKKIW